MPDVAPNKAPSPDAAAARRFIDALPEALRATRPARVLACSLESGRRAHSILLHGEDPAALESTVVALASAILDCPARQARTHPDYITLRPSGKARQIRIGDRGESGENTMRSLMRQVNQTPNRASRKLAVVFDADRMNAATANAFLKTLEEPPADSTILLVTTRPYDLLDTPHPASTRIDGAGAQTACDARWQGWLDSYSRWLGIVCAGPRTAPDVAKAIIGLYATSGRFSEVLGTLSDEAWEQMRSTLPDNYPDEQLAAMEAGARKGLRALLFAEVEAATAEHVRNNLSEATLTALLRVHEQMERAARLCDVFNMKEEAALEAFLLASLRQWSGEAQKEAAG
jgi:DNA polymerase-3 subunit delta'